MLKKELGLIDVFSIAAGAMISSGLFVLPGIAFARAGPAIILSYALAGILMIPTLLAITELSTAMPKTGGSYFFVERSLGHLTGTIAGLSIWLAIALKAAFAMIGIGALAVMFTNQPDDQFKIKLIAVAGCVFFMTTNLFSVKGTGRLQSVFVVGLLSILVIYIVKSFNSIDNSHYTPFMPYGADSVFAVAGMVFISFGGLTKVVDVAEEIKNSQRNLPLGMFLAFGVVNLLYILIVFLTVGLVEPDQLSGSLMPIAQGGQVILGQTGRIIIAAAAFLAFATTGNAGILSSSRTPMATSNDGLVPALFAKTSKRFKTPHFSLILTTTFMITVILSLSLKDLVKTASTIMIFMFILMNLSVIIMRHSGMQTYRPKFKAPLNPYLPIITIIVYAFLIFEMGKVPLALTGAFSFVAILWHLFYVQRKIERQSAIVYLVRNIVAKNIQRTGLEEELKQIALQRDEITPDRFDHLIKDCVILDINKSISAKELFTMVSEKLSPRLGIETEKLYDLFIQREHESSTIVKPSLAIPHVVIDGKEIFDVLLVRCKKGVIFSELQEPVRTAFILIGSADERNYHLRALMTVAHIVSEKGFEKRWNTAKNPEQLRDIVMLSSRKRG